MPSANQTRTTTVFHLSIYQTRYFCGFAMCILIQKVYYYHYYSYLSQSSRIINFNEISLDLIS
jgi:hypothetical protein